MPQWLASLGFDMRGAGGRLRRHPGYAVGAALSLALGMSIATAIFSMVNALFLRPLPYPAADRLVYFSRYIPGAISNYNTLTARQLVSLLDDAGSFKSVAAWRFGTPAALIGESGNASAYPAVDVTPNFFDVLGVRPALGRSFTIDDARLGASRPVIIGHSLWQSRFAGDPAIVGRIIRVSGAPHVVIGVMPRGFELPASVRIWLPYGVDAIRQEAVAASARDFVGSYATIARLGPGATRQRAEAETDLLFTRLDPESAGRPDRFHARVVSLAAYVIRDYRESLGLWVAAAIAIAILCAVNFTTMSLARGMRRRGEIAVRAAMGASPKRLIALLALEGAFTALGGGVLSVVVASALLAYSRLWVGASLPVPPTIDWHTIVFGIAGTTVLGALCALAPAVDLSKTDLRSIISAGAATSTAGGRELRGRRGLVALQIALALATVAVVASLVQADRRMQRFGPGYDYSSIVTGGVTVIDSTARPGLSNRVRDFFLGVPGVSDATVVRLPTGEAVGITPDFAAPEAFMAWQDIDRNFFTTLGVHPISGRLPTAEEVAHHAPVMVLSETTVLFAHFRGARIDPIGHRIRLRQRGKPAAWYTVIGVVPDVRFASLGFSPLSPAVYTFESVSNPVRVEVFAKVRGDPQPQLRSFSSKLKALDSRIIVSSVETVGQQVDRWRALSRTRTVFLGLVAALALLLAIVGVYGLTSFTAELRVREIGVRIALGASRQGLMRVIAGELWWMGCIGIAAGYFISMRVASLLDAQFANPLVRTPVVTFQVVPTALSAVALIVITAIGTFVPLRRALRIDVMRALQSG